MIQNINKIIFSRTKPEQKLCLIDSIEVQNISDVTENTMIKILREVGTRLTHSQDRVIKIPVKQQKGNGFNCKITAIKLIKKVPHIVFSVKFLNGEKEMEETVSNFIVGRFYQGYFVTGEKYSGVTCISFNEEQKVEVIRSILKTYVLNKYFLTKIA